VIFTTVLAIFGHAQPNLWLVVARTGAAVAAIMTFRIAARMTWWLRDAVAGDFWGLARFDQVAAVAPAVLAGVIAMVGLVLSGNLLTDSTLGYSEGLATAAILIGLERHIDGHPRQAFALGFVAALDRPEIWLFWGPYGLWLMWKDPGSRGLVIGLAVLTLVLWFVPQKWGGGSFTSGVSRAQHPRSNSAAFASCPFCTELADHAWTLVLLRIKLAAIIVIGVAGGLLARAWRTRPGWRLTTRRDRALMVITLSGLFGYGWWILIAIETQAGFSGNDRYLVIGSGFIEICGAVGFGWAAMAIARAIRERSAALRERLGTSPAVFGTTGLLALIFLFVPNWLGKNLIDLPATHHAIVYQGKLREELVALINDAGGAKKLESCGAGKIMVEGFQVPMVAWYFDVRTLDILDQPTTNTAGIPLNGAGQPSTRPWPNVIFQDRDTGHAALLPLVPTIQAWERAGAHYTFRITKHMYFFEDCSAQPNDPPMQFKS
jgi:hypothetical protein